MINMNNYYGQCVRCKESIVWDELRQLYVCKNKECGRYNEEHVGTVEIVLGDEPW